MIGWGFNLPTTLSIIPKAATMKFNTAMCFFLSALALFSSLSNTRFSATVLKFSAFLVLLISALTLFEYLFQVSLGIDNWLVKDTLSSSYPGRMSSATAFCFILVSGGSLSLNSKSMLTKRIAEVVYIIIATVALTAVFGYILQIPAESIIPFINSMALHTSVLFIILSHALSIKNHPRGAAAVVLSKLPGSTLLRWVLPLLIFFPLSLGYFLLYAINHTDVSLEFGVVICAVLCSSIFIVYIAIIALRLNRSELQRKKLKNSIYELNKELKRYKQALDASSIIAHTDPLGKITSVNDKFCEISKYNRSELIGKTHRIINSGYHSKEFFAELWRTISSGKVWVGGIKNKAKDGSYYWVHTAIIPFSNDQGEIVEYLAIRQDITKLKTLSTQYENLKLKNKEIEQFTYIASHDLQEPLRTVQSMISFISSEEGSTMKGESQQCLTYIEKATNRMSDLIKGLLDYSRIGIDKKLELTDCNQLVKGIVDDLSQLAQDARAQINIQELPILNAYKLELRLVFQNLISNAIKFRKPEIFPKIDIRVECINNHYKFSISDNGIGIANPDDRNIFAIFQRLNDRSDFEGTGIGLAHTEKIIHLHRGDIWVNSVLNEGSTFHFTIPNNLS